MMPTERELAGQVEGGCLCGACRYIARGAPLNVRVCHCRDCQRAVGAAFNVRALFPRSSVDITGPVRRFNSSPDLVRGSCGLCGTTIYSERASIDAMGLTFGSMDDPDQFAPTEHIWVSRKQAWVSLSDGLPQYPEAPPA